MNRILSRGINKHFLIFLMAGPGHTLAVLPTQAFREMRGFTLLLSVLQSYHMGQMTGPFKITIFYGLLCIFRGYTDGGNFDSIAQNKACGQNLLKKIQLLFSTLPKSNPRTNRAVNARQLPVMCANITPHTLPHVKYDCTGQTALC